MATEQKIRRWLKLKEGDPYSPQKLHDDVKGLCSMATGAVAMSTLRSMPESIPAGESQDRHSLQNPGGRSLVCSTGQHHGQRAHQRQSDPAGNTGYSGRCF